MTAEQWRRARDLFERALERSPDDLEEWLGREANDPEVAAEVRSLLEHDTRAGSFLVEPLATRTDLLGDGRFSPGEVVGSYRIVRELGRGGMGIVYLAIDTRLGRSVALKVVAPALVRDAAQRDRLRREARAAASLNAPGVCTVYALEEIGDDVLLTVEFVEGATLREEIARGIRPSPAQVMDTARELADALSSAHARGITHRDLKPENVMRTTSGRLKIFDFGLALVSATAPMADVRVTAPGALVGTPAYMSPEQLDGRVADARSDVFALGVLLYEYATGSHPFAATSSLGVAGRILEAEPTSLSILRGDLPHVLLEVVERCLRKVPSERFASASEVVEALASQAPSRPRPMSVRWWRRHMAALFVLYALAVGAAWLAKEQVHAIAEGGFVLIAVLATVGGVLRGHLLFAERTHDRATLQRELGRSTPVLVAVDLSIAAFLVVEGLLVARGRSVPGVLMAAVGVGIGLARLVLEPTTTEVAFRYRGVP